VLLGDYGAAGLAHRLEYGLGVKGLHGSDIEDFGADAFALEGLCGEQGLPY